jgi:hypothetical protein
VRLSISVAHINEAQAVHDDRQEVNRMRIESSLLSLVIALGSLGGCAARAKVKAEGTDTPATKVEGRGEVEGEGEIEAEGQVEGEGEVEAEGQGRVEGSARVEGQPDR